MKIKRKFVLYSEGGKYLKVGDTCQLGVYDTDKNFYVYDVTVRSVRVLKSNHVKVILDGILSECRTKPST